MNAEDLQKNDCAPFVKVSIYNGKRYCTMHNPFDPNTPKVVEYIKELAGELAYDAWVALEDDNREREG